MKIFSEKSLKIVYITVFLFALLIPGIWTFVDRQEAIGNEEEMDFEDADYWNIADKVDSYMNQKFGFRNKLVNLNNEIKYNVFSESGNDRVIVGKDGWFFFADGLDDYTGDDSFTDEEVDKIGKILLMVQEQAKNNGSQFVFFSAPNKMEIYGEYMPYYHVENKAEGNYEKLIDELEEQGVNYVDLKAILKGEKENYDYRLYYKTDSHWNDLGAAIAFENIMKQLGLEYTEYSNDFIVDSKKYKGDLEKMLFPGIEPSDDLVSMGKAFDFYYVSNYKEATDLVIQTMNDTKTGSVTMWRDSFGAWLYCYFADNFNSAEFRRELPYNLTNVSQSDVIAIELVERNLDSLLTYLPIINHKEAEIEAVYSDNTVPEIYTEKVNGYNLISAEVESIPNGCIEVYFSIETDDGKTIYEAYPSAKEGDACMYLQNVPDNAKLSVIYNYNGKIFETLKNTINCV